MPNLIKKKKTYGSPCSFYDKNHISSCIYIYLQFISSHYGHCLVYCHKFWSFFFFCNSFKAWEAGVFLKVHSCGIICKCPIYDVLKILCLCRLRVGNSQHTTVKKTAYAMLLWKNLLVVYIGVMFGSYMWHHCSTSETFTGGYMG